MKKQIISLVIVGVFLVCGLGVSIANATPVYEGYRERVYAEFGTATVDGAFTTDTEYGTNSYDNVARSEWYHNESMLPYYFTSNEFSFSVMNDETNMYFIMDTTYMNISDGGFGMEMAIDLDYSYDLGMDDGEISLFYAGLLGTNNSRYGALGEEYNLTINATSFTTSPNAYYNHTIVEFGLPMAHFGLGVGDTIPFTFFVGDAFDPYTAYPTDSEYLGTLYFANLTLAIPPEIVEIDSWNVFQTPNYCFGSDVYISINSSVNISIDYQKDVVCEMETHWFVNPTYRVNIDFTDYEVTDCEMDIILNYKDEAKSISGYFSKASIRVWVDDVKYQCTSETTMLTFDENIGNDGGYKLTVDSETTITMIELIVNNDFGDNWDNWMTTNI